MTALAKLEGIQVVNLKGRLYEWNDMLGQYWSVRGEPRALQECDVLGCLMSFNTGRGYSAGGQLVVARVAGIARDASTGRDNFRVEFFDQTRLIYGATLLGQVTQDALMAAYDRGRCDAIGPFEVNGVPA
ncbi:hypothetical protein D9M68_705710 [compost metagenome]